MKEDYLKISLDLSIMLLLYYWDKEHIAFFLTCLILLLIIFYFILYFEVIKPSDDINSIRQLISQKHNDFWAKELTSIFVIIPLGFDSPIVMLVILALYLITDRILFYKKFNTFV